MKPIKKSRVSAKTGKLEWVWVARWGGAKNSRRIPGLPKNVGIREAQKALDAQLLKDQALSTEPRKVEHKVRASLTVAGLFQAFIDSGALGLTKAGRARSNNAVAIGASVVGKHIVRGALGAELVADLTPEQIAKVLRTIENERTRHQVKCWWRLGLEWGVDTGKCARNVADGKAVKRAAPAPRIEAVSTHRRALTEREVDALLEHIEPEQECVIALALFAGLRRGEIYAMRKEWVNLRDGSLEVRGSHDAKVTKDGQAVAALPIDPALAPYLERQLKRFTDSPYLCPHPGVGRDGRDLLEYRGRQRRYDDNAPVLAIRAALRAGGCTVRESDHIDLHTLRHTLATRMVKAKQPLEHTRRMLRHKSIEITARLYTHLDLGDLSAAVAAAVGGLGSTPRTRVKEQCGSRLSLIRGGQEKACKKKEAVTGT